MSLVQYLRRFRETRRIARRQARSWGRDLSRPIKANQGRLALIVILVVALGAVAWMLIASWNWLSTDFWTWLRGEPNRMESGSTTVRNLGLLIAGLIALPLAIWRSWVAQRQADTAQQNLLNERYRQGAEMLDSEILSVRLGGIYALQRLAVENPKQYHVQVMQLLCAFVRHPQKGNSDKQKEVIGDRKKPELRSDVQDAVSAISACHARQSKLENRLGFRLDLRGVNLSGADMFKAVLSKANFSDADLSGAGLIGANLARAVLTRANLAGARLTGANLNGARFERANLSETRLESSDLAMAGLENANLSMARLSNASLTEAHLSNANLAGASLHECDLSKTRLQGANLARASLYQASLTGAILSRTNFDGAGLGGANLLGADLSNANMSNANLSPVVTTTHEVGKEPYQEEFLTKLTQAQLDVACAESDTPPNLSGAVDAETGEPLVWRGRAVKRQA